MRFISVVLLTIGLSSQAFAQADSTSIKKTSYLDARAGELVRMARERRLVADVSVESYKALTKERMSAGLRGIRRDRLLYRREVAGRLEWTRNGQGKIEILGAREVVPVAIKNVQIPSDLDSYMPHLAFDPADNQMLIGWKDNEFVRHPLAPDAERYYQYRTGNITTMQLPDGKVVRLIELEVIPRTVDPHNISGSFWLDEETHGVVQAAFKLSRDIDIIRDMEDEDDEDDEDLKHMPGFLKPMTAAVDYVTINYGLYDLKWWMPRSVLFEGMVRVGVMKMPMQYERTYSNYEIVGSDKPVIKLQAELEKPDTSKAATDSCRNKMSVNVNIGGDKPNENRAGTRTVQCGRWAVTIPNDTALLLNSPELPPDIFATGEELVPESELREIAGRIEKLGGGPRMLPSPVPDYSLLSVSNARYNRIEGLSVGPKGTVDFGAFKISGSARIGFADWEPNVELGVTKPFEDHTLTVNGYRRLNAMDPWARPFSFGASLSALLFGRDDADYYRSLGAEVIAEPSASSSHWYTLRLYTQKETAATTETNASLRRVFNGSFAFRPNLTADEITVSGGELTLRWNHGLDPDGLRFSGDLYSNGGIGTEKFARSALTLRASFPLLSSVSGALEASAGLTSKDAPLQHRWYLGGANSLRGYAGSVISGEAFWRGRAEIGYGMPAIKLVGFSDVGWAGTRDQYDVGKPLLSAGVGASMLDGIVRFDVARGLREPKGWSAMLYFDAAL